ncbi:MAG: PD40 domain-containing protein [Deltaproteobacteria bacterium]|nr:PD40 domain-containing protein [Deltaproteobacteria bacterium]
MKRALVLALFALAACQKGGTARDNDPRKTYGVRIADDGEVARVTTSPDGKYVAFLGQVERPKELGVPEGILVGLLELVPADGSGPARQLLGGVTNLEGSFAFSSDGAVLAAIKSFRFASHSGTLETVKVAGGEPVHLADDCSGFAFSADAKHLAWVCTSGGFLGNADGSDARKVTDGAATVDFSRDSTKLLVRRLASAGGDLLLVDVAGKGADRTIAKNVGDYAFSPDGADVAFTMHSADPRGGWELKLTSTKGGDIRALGEAVSSFRFSPDGKWLAYIGGVTPSKPFGDLFVAPSTGGAGTKVGERVEEYDFAPNSKAVAYLAKYNDNARSGTMMLQTLPPSTPAQTLHKPVKSFVWSPEGGYLAYSVFQVKDASLDLDLLKLSDLKPGAALADGGTNWAEGSREVANGAYGYLFAGEDKLIYRTECIMEGRACDLYVLPTDHAAMPGRLTGGVWRFSISKDGSRMLITYPRVDSETVADLGVMNLSGYGGAVGVDHSVELGAQFLDAHGGREAYGVIDKRRRGVYVAKSPLPEPGQLPPSLEPPGFKATYQPSTPPQQPQKTAGAH